MPTAATLLLPTSMSWSTNIRLTAGSAPFIFDLEEALQALEALEAPPSSSPESPPSSL